MAVVWGAELRDLLLSTVSMCESHDVLRDAAWRGKMVPFPVGDAAAAKNLHLTAQLLLIIADNVCTILVVYQPHTCKWRVPSFSFSGASRDVEILFF